MFKKIGKNFSKAVVVVSWSTWQYTIFPHKIKLFVIKNETKLCLSEPRVVRLSHDQ